MISTMLIDANERTVLTMNELIKALRYCVVHPYRPCDGCVLFETDGCINVLHGAAADAIERLTDEVDRKDKAIQGLLTQIERKDKTIERMRDLMKHYKAAYRTAYKLYQEARHGN